jgi:hypothetical protein
MRRVVLETVDIPEMVDGFYMPKMPFDSRSEHGSGQSKTYLYTFPMQGQEARSVQIFSTGKATRIILTSMRDPSASPFPNAPQTRPHNPTDNAPPAKGVPNAPNGQNEERTP